MKSCYIKTKNIMYEIAVLLVSFALLYIMNTVIQTQSGKPGVKACGMLCFIHFIIIFALWYKQVKFLNLYSFYVLSFFLFQCGQYVIYALGVDYNYFYIENYDSYVVMKSILFSSMCNAATLMAAPASLRYKRSQFKDNLNMLEPSAVYSVSKLIFIVLSIIELPYCFARFFIVIKSGYHGVRAFEELMPSIFSLIDMFYIPSIILCIIYSDRNKKIYPIALAVWAVLNSLNGDRSSGIAAIIILALMYLNGILKRNRNIKLSNHQAKVRFIVFVVIVIVATWLIPFAYNFRNHTGNTAGTNFIEIAVGDLGFSFFPLLATMLICPSRVGHLYGKSIIFSFISSFYPLSLDFTGIFRKMYEISKTGMRWMTEYYNFSFGLGYSLNAESYANFGMYGCLWILVLNFFVARVLAQPDYTSLDNKFTQYSSLSMLYILFTMPRRSCYYLTNFYIYYILITGLIILLFCKKRRY